MLFGQRDLANNTVRRFTTTVHVPVSVIMGAAPTMIPSLPWQLRNDVILTSPSPSGRRMLVVRQNEGEKEPTVLEIWGGGRLLKEIEVPRSIHRGVFNDGWFSEGATWNPDESKVCYVAEAPAAEKTPEWAAFTAGSRRAGEKSDTARAKPKCWRGKGKWEPDWGEGYRKKGTPRLFVLDLSTWEVDPVPGISPDLSCGQPLWSPTGEALAFVGWAAKPSNFETNKQLGIIYCMNRPSKIYALNLADKGATPTCLTQGLLSAHSPRFTPDGSVIIFLSHEHAATSGTHNGTAALRWLQWDGRAEGPPPEVRTMIAAVDVPETPEDFPGLYAASLPQHPFLADGHTIVLSTQWRSDQVIATVDTITGAVSRITPPPPHCGSWRLLDVRHDVLVACVSTPASPEKLMVARQSNGTWIWEGIQVATPEPGHPAVEAALLDMEYTVLQVPYGDPEGGDGDAAAGVLLDAGTEGGGHAGPAEDACEAIVLHRRSAPGPAPCVLVPHGGPHGAFTTSFVMYYAFLCALGYHVVLVNFRGSTGFGEAVIQALPGRIGEVDVADCLAALDAAAAAGLADASDVAVCGGSHGGFLTGHLLGQHPSKFKCGIMRNPVCNISLMSGISDIPDWCYVETFGSEEGKRRFTVNPSVEDMATMRAKSPIAYVDKVTAPLLMLLGGKDARVPAKDAKQYITALMDRADPLEVRVLMFPEDKHDLGTPQTEFESWINVAAWLKQHMGRR